MIGTDCEKLAKGAWRLIVLLLVQVLFEKMISIRSASSSPFRDECVYTYIYLGTLCSRCITLFLFLVENSS